MCRFMITVCAILALVGLTADAQSDAAFAEGQVEHSGDIGGACQQGALARIEPDEGGWGHAEQAMVHDFAHHLHSAFVQLQSLTQPDVGGVREKISVVVVAAQKARNVDRQ